MYKVAARNKEECQMDSKLKRRYTSQISVLTKSTEHTVSAQLLGDVGQETLARYCKNSFKNS